MAKRKKTREQKIIADLKRKLVTKTPQVHAHSSTAPTYSIPTSKFIEKPNFVTQSVLDKRVQTHRLIVNDLQKTFILSVLAIAIQLVVYKVIVH